MSRRGLAGISRGSRRGSRRGFAGVSQEEQEEQEESRGSWGESWGESWGDRWEVAGGSLGESWEVAEKTGSLGKKREESQGGGSEFSTAASASTAAPRCLASLRRCLATALAHGRVGAHCEVSRLTNTARTILARATGSPRAPDNNERHEVDPSVQRDSTGQRRGAMQPDTGRAGRGMCG